MKSNKGMNRRSFVNSLCAGTCGAAIHSASHGADGMFAYANPGVMGALSHNRSVFVLVNLAGGCSYNIAPIYHAAWRDRNPTISYGPENSLPVSSAQGLHPSLTAFKQAYDQGKLALLNSVGLPNQSRSHDEATVQWYRAHEQGGNASGGWAARLTSQAASIFSGISLAGTNPLIRGGSNPPRALSDLSNFGESQLYWNDERTKFFRDTRTAVMGLSAPPASDGMSFVRGSMEGIEASLDTIRAETARALPDITNPFPNTGFGRACRDAAKLIAAPVLGVRFVFLQQGGYDTHSGERVSLTNLLNDLNGGIRALVQTTQALNRWDDVCIATMSEFCRTFENGSEGTDHGARAPSFLMGGSVRGRVVNPPPSTAQIAAAGSYLPGYDIDFRQIYREAVTRMGFNADLIFPNTLSFSPLNLFT